MVGIAVPALIMDMMVMWWGSGIVMRGTHRSIESSFARGEVLPLGYVLTNNDSVSDIWTKSTS